LKLTLKKNIKYSMCSCGLSNKIPYCDNNHREYNKKNNTSYKSVKVLIKEDSVVDIKCSNWIEFEKKGN